MIVLILKFLCMAFLLYISCQAINKICDSINLLFYKQLIKYKTKECMYIIHILSMIGCEYLGQRFIYSATISLDEIEIQSMPIILWALAMSFLLYSIPCFAYDMINATYSILEDDKYAKKICTAIICIGLILIPFTIPLITRVVF